MDGGWIRWRLDWMEVGLDGGWIGWRLDWMEIGLDRVWRFLMNHKRPNKTIQLIKIQKTSTMKPS